MATICVITWSPSTSTGTWPRGIDGLVFGRVVFALVQLDHHRLEGLARGFQQGVRHEGAGARGEIQLERHGVLLEVFSGRAAGSCRPGPASDPPAAGRRLSSTAGSLSSWPRSFGALLHHLGGAHAALGQGFQLLRRRPPRWRSRPATGPAPATDWTRASKEMPQLAQLGLLAGDVLRRQVLAHVDDPARRLDRGLQAPGAGGPGLAAPAAGRPAARRRTAPACRHSAGAPLAPAAVASIRLASSARQHA